MLNFYMFLIQVEEENINHISIRKINALITNKVINSKNYIL